MLTATQHLFWILLPFKLKYEHLRLAPAVDLLLTNFLFIQAILSVGINASYPDPSVTIRFRNGNILLGGPPYKPHTLIVQYFDSPDSNKIAREEKRTLSFEGGGWQFQADEVARCIQNGKLESAIWSHDKSLLEMDVFDAVRKQGGYEFPPGVEQVV